MNRLQKLLAAATLLVLPVIAACGEDPVPPPATGSIMGQVSIEGMGIDGVSVNLSNGASTTTAGGGTYRFDGVEAGAYTVTISGFPADASFDATSAAATIPPSGGSVTLDFRGSYIRTASIMGTVTVENTGLGGVTVRLSGMADAQTATDNNGQYAFTGLRAGTYAVEISGFDMDEVGFGSVSSSATVGVGESKIISFDGTYLRTAGIMGQVSVEGVGLEGVTVTMTGEGEDETDVTDAGGLYGFSKLKAGDYSVAISGFDPDEVEFSTTSMNVSVALGETANIPFEGTLLRTSGISGRVSLDDGMGLDGVEVVLAGAADDTTMTSNGGQYAFAGLAEGTYVLTMTNPDANAYNFEETSATIVLGDAESNITNFDGTHTQTASISGVLFVDEVMQDKMHTAGEPSLTAALAPLVEHGLLDPTTLPGLLEHAKVIVRGPSLNDPPRYGQIQLDGSFTVGELVAGSYQVELPANNEMVAAALAAAGVDYVGESMVRTIAAGETGTANSTVNFPFRITMQTIGVGAVMGNAEMVSDPPLPVAGVTLALFPTAQDADAGTNLLGMGTKTGETGMAGFTFPRADDTSPGSEDTDNIVFVKVVDAGHEDLMVSDRDVIEVQYPGIARVHGAPTTVRFQNVAVNFQFWIKNDADARGGDVLVDGWHTQVFMGDSEDALMMPDPEDDMKMVNLTMPSESAEDEDGMQGRVMVSYRVTPDQLADGGATFNVALRPDNTDDMDEIEDWQQPMAMGETWEEVGDGLTYTHTGFELPALNTHEVNDLNLNPKFGQAPARFTFTTQTLTVGVYREVDDEPGFTDFRAAMGGDKRPVEAVAEAMSAQLMTRDSRNRLRPYEYDHDGKESTDDISSMAMDKNGMASFPDLPADGKFTVRFHAGSDRVLVGETDAGDIETFGQDLDIGMSYGSFGDESGAMPEVKLCSLTTSRSPKDNGCATFGYQWKTGSVSGMVDGPGGATVTLAADTDADDRSTKTGADSKKDNFKKFSIAEIQDGEYELTTPNTADNKYDPKGGYELSIFHDETEDDEDEDTEYVGTAWSMTDHDFTATKLRQSIKGYVANDDDDDQQSRGDESVSGVEVRLLKIAKDGVSENKKDTTFVVAAETTTDRSGLYEFNDLTENDLFYVQVPRGDNYVGLHTEYGEICDDLEADECANQSGEVTPDTYPALEEGEFNLPRWDHMTNTASNNSVTVKAPSPSTVSADLVNFALVFTDNEVAGKVTNVSGSNGGISIELGHCETFTAAMENDPAECSWSEGAHKTDTDSKGNYSFGDLLEGYYQVNILGTRFSSVRRNADGEIDPNGDEDTEVTMHIADVMGRDDYDGGNNFTVYNSSTGTDTGLEEVTVTGDTGGDEDDEQDGTVGTDEVTGISMVITWAAKSVTVEAEAADSDASVSVAAFDGTDPDAKRRGCSGGVCTISFDPSDSGDADADADPGDTMIEITVAAENGYNKAVYTLDGVSRADPIGHEPDAITVTDAGNIDVGLTMETTLSGTDAATQANAALHIDRSDGIECAQTIKKVTVGGTNLTGTTKGANDCDGENFTVPLASTTSTIVRITMTSEDDVDRVYQLTINRS